ncbi:hypothetical protein K438DRAFT_301429 [Mycena galopus ATCC 62051]|nr:hypothetical protein K438DRAFT_301429 [Mycena galopus ATCC 62051]
MRTVRLSPLLLAFCVGVSQASPIIVNGGKMSEPWHTAGLTMETDCILPGIVPNGVCSLLSALPSLFASGVSPTSTQMTASSSSTGARTLPSNSGSISSTNTFLSSTVTDPSSGQSTSVPGASLSPAHRYPQAPPLRSVSPLPFSCVGWYSPSWYDAVDASGKIWDGLQRRRLH